MSLKVHVLMYIKMAGFENMVFFALRPWQWSSWNCCRNWYHKNLILWPVQCWGYFCPKHKDAKIFENHLNPVMLVFIEKLLLGTNKWVPMCQGFFALFCISKLATSSQRVNWVDFNTQRGAGGHLFTKERRKRVIINTLFYWVYLSTLFTFIYIGRLNG